MKTHPIFRSLFLLGLLSAGLHAQDNTIQIVFENERGRSESIGAFQRGGTTYISLNDLAQVAHINTYANLQSHKFEVKLPTYRIKVTANNPFLVVTENGQQSVVQLPRDVVFAANSFFLPLEETTRYLELFFNTTTSFEKNLRIIRVGVPSAPAFDVPMVRFEPKTNGLLIRIVATRRLPDVESWLREDKWLYVTIPEAHADTTAINALRPLRIVKEIVAIQSPTSVQLTFRLSGKITTTELVRDEASNDLLLAVHQAGTEEKTVQEQVPPPAPEPQQKPVEKPVQAEQKPLPEQPVAKSEATPKGRELQSDLEIRRKRWRLDVIVLDAGHGGKDWGAIGVTGVREKDVTLGVALKLGKLIEKSLKGVKVIYTRKDDRFVQLDKRGQIANEAGGKLFISIHANSLKRKPSSTRGFEVYLLRPGRTEEAIAIAERENSVIQLEEGYENRYKQLTDENFILVTMAQSAHMKASERFADLVQQELDDRTNLANRGVKQAGFLVLVGASMPNVLIETAYISNREDERIVRSDGGQQKIAESIFRAVKTYRAEYEKLLDEGRDLGQK
jgi:N-acetylmuramoyl-L-alanine amidase